MHSEATPRRPPVFRSAPISVTTMRAPEAPIGWPSAQAPPWTLTFLVRQAELAHRRHGHDRERLVDLVEIDLLLRPAGALEQLADRADRRGREPARLLRVRGVRRRSSRAACRPRFSAVERRISTSAAAPSEIELEFAAVTVPSLRNAGFSVGIFSRFALHGCSSLLDDALRPCAAFTVDRRDLPGERAVVVRGLRARAATSTANASCASRVNRYFCGAVLGEDAHQPALVIGVLEPVEEHVVEHAAAWPMR